MPDAWVGVQVSGDPSELPRQHLDAAPYALACGLADSAAALQGAPVSATAPVDGQLLRFTGSQWVPYSPVLDQDDQGVVTPGSTTSATFVDAPIPAWNWPGGPAGKYLLRVDTSLYAANAQGAVDYQVLVDGAPIPKQPASAQHFSINAMITHVRLSWVIPVTFTAGPHVIKLQWKAQQNGIQLTMDSNDFRTFTIQG
jgi:hypothetical protein